MMDDIRVTAGQDETYSDYITAEFIKFPGGEVNVRLDTNELNDYAYGDPYAKGFEFPEGFSVKIIARIWDSDGIMKLLMTTDAIRRWNPHVPIYLLLPYVPYARQDRVCNPGEALAARVMCELINSQNYSTVEIWDPHSDVVPALLNNVKIVEQCELLSKLAPSQDLTTATLLISPDAGALKKVNKASRHVLAPWGLEVIRADKTRNTSTGELGDTKIYGVVKGKQCLIVDDICDGGYTFTLLAKELKAKEASRIALYVTHGIFSKGVDALDDSIDAIYCPNLKDKEILVSDTKKRLVRIGGLW